MRTPFFLLVIVMLIASSCKKDGKGCWQGWDNAGHDATGILFCDVTKAEAEEKVPNAWFYRQGETKHCRTTGSGSSKRYYYMPVSIKDRYVSMGVGPFTSVDCNSFCSCGWNERSKGKLTGEFGPQRFITEFFNTGDTCSKLSIGRIITVRETTDSLITREVRKKIP